MQAHSMISKALSSFSFFVPLESGRYRFIAGPTSGHPTHDETQRVLRLDVVVRPRGRGRHRLHVVDVAAAAAAYFCGRGGNIMSSRRSDIRVF